jgi:hypothetical protein
MLFIYCDCDGEGNCHRTGADIHPDPDGAFRSFRLVSEPLCLSHRHAASRRERAPSEYSISHGSAVSGLVSRESATPSKNPEAALRYMYGGGLETELSYACM